MKHFSFKFGFFKFKFILLTGLCLFITACSSNLVYKNLDWVIPWYVDDYVSLNDDQMAQFKSIVDEGLYWHKNQELKRYQDFLQSVHVKLDGTLDQDDINDLQLFARSSFEAVEQRMLPTLLPLFKTLDAEQQQEFWGNMNNKQKEYEEEYLSRSDNDYINELNEKYIENSERLLGPLTDDQKLIILNALSILPRADEEWLKARQSWLEDVKLQYESQSDPANDIWQGRLQEAWLNRDQHYSAVAQLKIDERDTQAKQLMLRLINTKTEKQTKHAKEFIQSWQAKLAAWQQ